jgi:hypothetical protein
VAKLLTFPAGTLPAGPSEAAQAQIAERQKAAAQLRSKLLSDQYTRELYGEFAHLEQNVKPTDLMPTYDEVAFDNGGYKVYDEMGRNVLKYAAFREGRIDVATSLPLTFLPGIKGDPEAEAAREEVAAAWEFMHENHLALRSACRGLERGFSPLENIMGVQTRGKARGLVTVVEMIDRPLDWFAFDYLHRPRFKKARQSWPNDAAVVPEMKVSFLRSGSNHRPEGRGYGQDAYPVVWAIDTLVKQHMAMTERFSYMPVVVRYPAKWANTSKYADLKANMGRQTKNALLLPTEGADGVTIAALTDGAYAAANATGTSRMEMIREWLGWLAMFVQGGDYSSGNTIPGSFARDKVADGSRLYKAPGDAACIEAFINRGFVRITMLANRPNLSEDKWPRAAIDASAGEDLELMLRIFESGAKMEIPIAAVTWSETFKVRLADDGEAVLNAPSGVAQPTLQAPETAVDALDDSIRRMSEPASIVVHRGDGTVARYRPNQPVYVKGFGIKRAGLLAGGDVIVDDATKFSLVS